MFSLTNYDAWKATAPEYPEPVEPKDCCYPTMCSKCVVRGGFYEPEALRNLDPILLQDYDLYGFSGAVELCEDCPDCSCDDFEVVEVRQEKEYPCFSWIETDYRCNRCGRTWTESTEPDWDTYFER